MVSISKLATMLGVTTENFLNKLLGQVARLVNEIYSRQPLFTKFSKVLDLNPTVDSESALHE
jgi:hypothetical protein